MLYPQHLTIPQHLSAHGYTTALVGKMHLKGPKWMGGFDHRTYGDLIVDRFCFHQPDPGYTWDGRWCNHQVGRFAWAGETHLPESLLADGVVTRESLAFLLEHQDNNPDKPWFFCAGYSRPHFPFTAPGRYIRRHLADPAPLPPRPDGYPEGLHPHHKYIVDDFHIYDFSDEVQTNTLAAYYACVDYMDDCIGELLDGLRKAGMLENTYVVYVSDHGDMAGEHGLWSKRSYYDGSARVPLLISGPGIEGGRSVSSPVELLDFFPTFCEWAGVAPPEGLDGESLVPILDGKTSSRKKRYARSELLGNPDQVLFRMARDERWKYAEFPSFDPILFDMVNDPDENTNLLESGTAPADCPIDDLKRAASDGVTWEEVFKTKAEESANRPETPQRRNRGPVQYQLENGCIVDGDAFLYEGLAESS
jgi:choline-sulfatase